MFGSEILLEGESVGFKRHEAAAGPFANMDTAMLTGLDIRKLSVIKKAQQQQQQQQQQQHQGKLYVTLLALLTLLSLMLSTVSMSYGAACPRCVSLSYIQSCMPGKDADMLRDADMR